MARPQNKTPEPALRLKGNVWRIRWRDGEKRYEFSTGHREESKSQAETCLMETSLALRGAAEWPKWADGMPTIKKWLSRADEPQQDNFYKSQNDVLLSWYSHYESFASEKMLRTRHNHLLFLMTNYNLLTLTSADAAAFMKSLSKIAPKRYLSETIISLMGDRALTRPKIIELLTHNNVEYSVSKLRTALMNRECFQRIKNKSEKAVFIAIYKPKVLSPKTRNIYLGTFNMFYDWAIKEDYVKNNPFADIKNIRVDSHADIIWCSKEERNSILEAANGSFAEPPLWIAFYSGLRLGEIANLKWDDIDLDKRWIHVKKSKTGKTRRVPISDGL